MQTHSAVLRTKSVMYHLHRLVACVLRGASWWWQNLVEACWTFGSKWLIYVNVFTMYYVHCIVSTMFVLTTAQWFDTKIYPIIQQCCPTDIWLPLMIDAVPQFEMYVIWISWGALEIDLIGILKKYLYERYCILISSMGAMDVKFGVTLRKEQDTEGNILVKEGTSNVRLKVPTLGSSWFVPLSKH